MVLNPSFFILVSAHATNSESLWHQKRALPKNISACLLLPPLIPRMCKRDGDSHAGTQARMQAHMRTAATEAAEEREAKKAERMYKSKLQELCQKRSWDLPKYTTTKQGLDHNPSFSATVLVNGLSFHTVTLSKSSKEAQNDAASLAFDHFSLPDSKPKPSIPSSSSFPQPSLLLSSGSSSTTTEAESMCAAGETFPHTIQEEHQNPKSGYGTSRLDLQVNEIASVDQENDKIRDVQHLYKNELQIYAQKRNLDFPVYFCEREGPPHACCFKCKVTIDGKTYESSEFFSTLKEAEHAAAKVALTSLLPQGTENDENSAFYKNLLQQLVQKVGFHLPTYDTSRSGEAHSPVFVSRVEIEGEQFFGEEAKTKKQAEISAAKVAYNALRERKCKSSHSHISPPSLQEQEVLKLLPSCLESHISTNMQQHVRSNVPMISSPSAKKMGNGGSASTNILNGSEREIFPLAAPSEYTTDSFSPSTSNCFESAVDSSLETLSSPEMHLSYKKITVYPASKRIPDGTTLLPMCDDNWVAFRSQ